MNGGAEEEQDSPLILRYIALIHAQITEMLLDHHVRGSLKTTWTKFWTFKPPSTLAESFT